jgi:2'-5' RNA ligase
MRVFAALPLPGSVLQALEDTVSALKRRYPRLRTAGASGIHLTLHFFGELDAQAVEKLGALWENRELAGQAIDASLGAIGQYPEQGMPRVIWIGIQKGQEGLRAINNSFQKRISRLGYHEVIRGFSPHITLARNSGAVMEEGWSEGIPVPKAEFSFGELVLFQSILTPRGAEYVPLRRLSLNGGGA